MSVGTSTSWFCLVVDWECLELKEYWEFRNVRNVGNFRNVGNVRRDRQTQSVIHFQNHKLELILMMMVIFGMVRMSGMLEYQEFWKLQECKDIHQVSYLFWNHKLKLNWMMMGISRMVGMSGLLRISCVASAFLVYQIPLICHFPASMCLAPCT